jgi:hypothetical protein
VKYALLQGSLYGADEKRVAIQTTREVKKAIEALRVFSL